MATTRSELQTASRARWALSTPSPSTRRKQGAWSLRVGSVFGIDLYVHATFVLLLIWIGATHLMSGQGAREAVGGVGLVGLVFGIVVLHELGHALMARRFGIRTRDITLLPMGGVARLERMPDDPKQELLVALAGPAVNVVLAAALFGVLFVGSWAVSVRTVSLVGGPLLAKLAWINVGLATFNLLPAFPMDGGRVLRALLAMRVGRLRATDYAARLGQALAVGLGVAGIFVNPVLTLVAVFVWTGAAGEAALEHARYSLEGVTVGDAMLTSFRTLAPSESVGEALAHALADSRQEFPVEDRGRLVGVLTRADLLRAVAAGSSAEPVQNIMQCEIAVADEHEALNEAMPRLQEVASRTMAVLRNGVVVGLITPERIGEHVVMEEASRVSRRR